MYMKICSTFFKSSIPNYLILRTITLQSTKYSSNPPLYVSSNKNQRHNAWTVIDEFSDELRKISGKCMDIGCGPGDITNDIILPALHPNAVIIGTDISEDMIKYARKTYSKERQLDFDVLDIQTKELPAKYISEFDHIFSFHALHWCFDIKQAFKNIYRMLRPNGTMLVLVVSLHPICKVIQETIQDNRFAPYIKDVNISPVWPFQDSVNPNRELKGLLKEIGFKIDHCSHRNVYHFDDNSDQFLSSILAFLEFIDNIPHDQKEIFKKEIARKFTETQISFKRSSDNKTVILNVYNLLIAFAKK